MEKGNILACGREGLYQLKDELLTLEDSRAELTRKEQEEQRLERELERKEKGIEEEIQLEVKKREHEVSMSYEEQINRFKTRRKKVQAKKDKSKSALVSERIAVETAALTEENRKLNEEAKSVLQKGGISKVYNNRLFYALFAPKGVSDMGILVVTALFCVLVIPRILQLLFIRKAHGIITGILYLIVCAAFGGCYYLIFQRTKGKNMKAIADGKEIRYKMRKNDSRIRSIKKEIKQDSDESQYNLNGFDQEIKEFDEKINELTKQKADALAVLRNTTSHLLADGVRSRHAEELAAQREQYHRVYEENKSMEDQIKEMTMYMANTYEQYLGKSCMNVSAIDVMINLMEENQIDTVADALRLYQSIHQQEAEKQKGKRVL